MLVAGPPTASTLQLEPSLTLSLRALLLKNGVMFVSQVFWVSREGKAWWLLAVELSGTAGSIED